MTKETILALVRHILTTGGGALASRGVIDGGDTELVVGALVTIIGFGWSLIDKRRQKAKLAAARM